MCIFKNQEKIKQDNIFSVMTKSLDTSRLFGQSSFIFLKNISGLVFNREDDINSPHLVRPPVELGQPRPVKQKGIGQLGGKGQAHMCGISDAPISHAPSAKS